MLFISSLKMKLNNKVSSLFPVLAISAAVLLADRAGGQTFTTLHSFVVNPDGGLPAAGLLLLGNTLYGTTQVGTTNQSGTVFAVQNDGAGFAPLYSFSSYSGIIEHLYNNDGVAPACNLVSSDNILYGTTENGGTNGNGTVFAVTAAGTRFTNLYTFSGDDDGGFPYSGLTLSGSTLYGTVEGGGANGNGAVFAVNKDGSCFTNLHAFSATGNNGLSDTNTDGSNPWGGLRLSGDTLYGTTVFGGSNGFGTVFSLNTNGTGFKVLHAFAFGSGGVPRAGLLLSHGALYGVASEGGPNSSGAIFALNVDGTGFTNLYNFSGGNDGSEPWASLLLLGDKLYGTTVGGGTHNNGTIFSIRTDGTGFTNLYDFAGLSHAPSGYGTNSDGANPYGSLIFSGYTLYGTAENGGTNGYGTVFSLTLPFPPQLTITPWGGNVLLTWPTNVTVYSLECASNLSPPVIWSAVSPAPAVVAGQNIVTNPVASRQMFYRLSQ